MGGSITLSYPLVKSLHIIEKKTEIEWFYFLGFTLPLETLRNDSQFSILNYLYSISRPKTTNFLILLLDAISLLIFLARWIMTFLKYLWLYHTSVCPGFAPE